MSKKAKLYQLISVEIGESGKNKKIKQHLIILKVIKNIMLA